VRIKVTDNFPDVTRKLVLQQKQARFAAAVALTRTARDVKDAELKEIDRVFDRPTPYTRRSLFMSPATKAKLEAQVWLKDDRAGSGTPATRYLLPHIEGGSRGTKGFERALQRQGLMPPGYFAVPASGVKLDAFGNVSKGTINRILSQLRVQTTAGYESRATGSARSKRTIRNQGVEYFAITKPTGRLKPGIYGRYRFAHGSAVKPMFIYVAGVRYSPRFRFFEVADQVVATSFPRHFEVAFAQALETAR
jgi:hypothetical protein